MHLEGASKFEQPMQDYYRCADEISKIFALNMALKMKVFDTVEELASTKPSVKNIMTQLNFKTSERHLSDFLDQLFLHGLLDREGLLENAVYYNTDYTRKYLLTNSPNHYNNVFLNLDRYLRKYESFEKNFPTGKTRLFSEDLYSNEQDLKSYMDYFYRTNTFNFDNLVDKIDFSRYKRVVDIHGLAGVLAMQIRKKYNQCTVISFENKKLQTLAETRVKGNDMWDAVKLEYGNLHKDKIPEADCVIAPHILMQYSNDNRKRIIRNIFDQLPNNGDLIIMENLIDENRSKDDCGMKISFMFAMMGDEGFTLSYEEYRKMLLDAGFMDVSRIQRSAGVCDLIIAKKLDKAL